jgi:hypothetical protein
LYNNQLGDAWAYMDKSACMRWGSVPGIWNLKAGEAALACGADAVSRLLAHGAGKGKAGAQGSHLRLLRQCLKETRVRRANYDECAQLCILGNEAGNSGHLQNKLLLHHGALQHVGLHAAHSPCNTKLPSQLVTKFCLKK